MSSYRYYFMDGLRGFFSFVVLVYHALCTFYIKSYPWKGHFGVFLDGDMAVNIFFIISGFSLTVKYFDTCKSDPKAARLHIRRMAVARYFRLAFPCLFASFFMFSIYKFGIDYYRFIPEDMKTSWWSYAYIHKSDSIYSVLQFSLYDIFFPAPFVPVSPYTGVYYITNMWTMSLEFFGSIFIFIYSVCIAEIKNRVVIGVGMTLFFCMFGSQLSFFIAGAVITDIVLIIRGKILPNYCEFGVLIVIFVLGAIYCPENHIIEEVLYAFCLVMAIAISRNARFVFSSGVFRYIGEKSFSLYLVHMPIIVSLQSYLYLKMIGKYSMNLTIFVSASACVAISLLVAHLFCYLDKFSIRLSHRFARLIIPSEPSSC